MPKKKTKKSESAEDLLRDLMIVQLGLAGLSRHQVREIVGVDIHRVTRILRHFKKSKS
jgi:transposase